MTQVKKWLPFCQSRRYQLLIQCLEDLEDVLEMVVAVQTETDSRDYQEIQADLIKKGKFLSEITEEV